jgi:hypothetical protein
MHRVIQTELDRSPGRGFRTLAARPRDFAVTMESR